MLSAADSDLAAFGAAHATLPKDFPSVRLTNLLALGHPASVDLYVERTLCDARIVVLRMTVAKATGRMASRACAAMRCAAARIWPAFPVN